MKTSVYLTKEDIQQHCTTENLWMSKFGQVYDYTNLVRTAPSNLVEALIRSAGQDITCWFDKNTKDFPKCSDAIEVRYRLPYGLPMLHTEKDNKVEIPWWKDEQYKIGLLGNSRPIQILNTLTLHKHQLDVCEEENLCEIAARYTRFNSSAMNGYQWRFDEKDLEMDKTLTQNGIPDERSTYLKLGWPHEQWYVPCIVLIWKDQMI